MSSSVGSVLEQKKMNLDYLNAFEQQKLSPVLWIIEDITGKDLTVDSFELVEKKVVSPLDRFKAYRSQNFKIIDEYLNNFNDKLLFNLEGKNLSVPDEVYSYTHIIKYKMFNRIFYSVLDEYKGKIHNMRLIPLE